MTFRAAKVPVLVEAVGSMAYRSLTSLEETSELVRIDTTMYAVRSENVDVVLG